jgi:hypothetical protein
MPTNFQTKRIYGKDTENCAVDGRALKYCDVFNRSPSLICNRGRMFPWIRSPLGIVALHGNQQ